MDDEVLESSELFSVLLSSDDPDVTVMVGMDNVSVVISDNDGMHVLIYL